MRKKLLISAVFMMLIIIAPSFVTATDMHEDNETWKIKTKGFIIDYTKPDGNTVEFYMIIGLTRIEGREDKPVYQFTNGATPPGGLKLDEMNHFSLRLNNHFVSLSYDYVPR